MDKLQVAHDYAKGLVESYGDVMQLSEIIAKSWWLADAMFEEAEKRKDKTLPDALWQPDWSLAPDDAVACAMDSNGDKEMFWHTLIPRISNVEWVGNAIGVYNNHGYTGDWRNSLRIRPQK